MRSPSNGHQGGAGGEGSSGHTPSPGQVVSDGFPGWTRLTGQDEGSGWLFQASSGARHQGGTCPSPGQASPHPTCPQPLRRGCWKQTEDKGWRLPFSCTVQPGPCLRLLWGVLPCRLVLFENSSERTMSGPLGDVAPAPKEAPSLGALRAEAALLGKKEGLTDSTFLSARTFHSIVLPHREPQGNESGQPTGCPCHNHTVLLMGSWRGLRACRTGGPAQAGGVQQEVCAGLKDTRQPCRGG